MKTKKEKPRCKNCGDETSFPSNADWVRAEKGWCINCYRLWNNHQTYEQAKRDRQHRNEKW